MAFTLLQAGSNLKSVNSNGGLSSALTLPTGVQLATNLIPRFARFKQYVVVVNTPSRPITVDPSGIVRILTPNSPSSPLALAAGVAGIPNGTYLGEYTYKILDALGNTIAESFPSPLMTTAVTVASQQLVNTFVDSPDPGVNAIQLYRTATNGSVYFPSILVPNNIVTSVNDNLADSSLGIVPIGNLGSAPDLTLIAEWGGRLWGVSRTDVDDLRYTEAGLMYAWTATNSIPIPHIGESAAGITALIPRRNALGVARQDVFLQIAGSSTANFIPTVVNGGEQLGVMSQESVVVYNDIAYFLWRDGVYTWDSTGIRCITNGKVRSWFTTDTYFNRSMFWRSFAQLDPQTLKYRLFLAGVGQTVNNLWIEYDLTTQAWWGPHNTTAFTPTSAVQVQGTDMTPYFMIGSQEGYLSKEQDAKNDWGIQSIFMDASTQLFDADAPMQEKYFGEFYVYSFPQVVGALSMTPALGTVDGVTQQPAFVFDLTQNRLRLGRIGVGQFFNLRIQQNTINTDVALYGFEVNPVNIVGTR